MRFFQRLAQSWRSIFAGGTEPESSVVEEARRTTNRDVAEVKAEAPKAPAKRVHSYGWASSPTRGEA